MEGSNLAHLILEKIESLNQDLKKEIRETQDMCVQICKDCRDLVREVNLELRNKLEVLEKRYNEKLNELSSEVAKLKNPTTVMPKQAKPIERRKNIIITGGKFILNKEGVYKAVDKFLRVELDVNASIDEVIVINNNEKKPKILVKLLKMEDKKLIMKNKTRLRRIKDFIYIDDDFTREEREKQKKVREAAKIEREKGKNIKIGYNKLKINTKWVNIDEYRNKK